MCKNNSPQNSPNLKCTSSSKCFHTRRKKITKFLCCSLDVFLSWASFFLLVVLADGGWKGVRLQLNSVLPEWGKYRTINSPLQNNHTSLSQGSIYSTTVMLKKQRKQRPPQVRLFLTIIRKLMQTATSSLSFFLLLAICISPGTAIFLCALMFKYAVTPTVERPLLECLCTPERVCSVLSQLSTFLLFLLKAWLGLLGGKGRLLFQVRIIESQNH